MKPNLEKKNSKEEIYTLDLLDKSPKISGLLKKLNKPEMLLLNHLKN